MVAFRDRGWALSAGVSEPTRGDSASRHTTTRAAGALTLFQKSPGLFDCLDGIAGKHALVGRLLRRQRGLVSEHDVDEL
jgi:hypothetical protein